MSGPNCSSVFNWLELFSVCTSHFKPVHMCKPIVLMLSVFNGVLPHLSLYIVSVMDAVAD